MGFGRVAWTKGRSEGGFALRGAAAMFLLGPAAIHFAVAPEHLVAYLPYGLFFCLLGTAQLALAGGILLRPSPALLLGGAGMTVLVVAVWLLSRTAGMPFGPFAGQPEPVGLPDLLATCMECAAAGLLVIADFRLDSSREFRLLSAVPGLAVSMMLSVAMTLVGLAAVATAVTN